MNAPVATAIGLAQCGRKKSARDALMALNGMESDDAAVLAAAGLTAYVAGDYSRSIELLDRATHAPGGGFARRLCFERQARLGWTHEAIETARSAVAAGDPKSARWHAEMAALFARRRAFRDALEHGEAALSLGADAAPLLVELANIHAQLDDADAVSRCVRNALAVVPDSVPYRLEAARLLVSVGRFDDASAELRASLSLDPTSTAYERLGSIAVWAGRDAEADEHAQRALEIDAEYAPARRLLGVLAKVSGRESRAHFEEALGLDAKDSESYLWLAELSFERNDDEQAHQLISRAIGAARGYLFSAQLLRFVVAMSAGFDEGDLGGRIEHLIRGVTRVCPELAEQFAARSRSEWRDGALLTLRRMRGNRSVDPTFLPDGVLTLVRPGNDPRYDSRRAIETIRICGVGDALAAIGEVGAEHSWSSLPLAHKGELEMWMGDLPAARASLNEAIAVERGTRWAYIGLATIEVLEGNLEAALAINAHGVRVMHGTEGPALFGVRGETLRLLGRLDDAERDLVRSVELNPSRLSSAVNLGLLRLEQKRPAGEIFRDLMVRAPALMHDAAAAAQIDIIRDDSSEPPELRDLFTEVLSMFRGNRSSTCQTYFTAGGRLRVVPPYSRGASGAHARDDDDLLRASALLKRGVPR